MAYDPSTSILAGLDATYLQNRLTALQKAYVELNTGQAVATASYAQGDGTKSATFRQSDMASLIQTIRQLQAQLGIICSPRQAIGVRFS